MKKKRNFIIGGIIIIFIGIVIFIFGISYFNKEENNVEGKEPKSITTIDFNNYIIKYKEDSSEYILGENEEEYRSLISKSEEAIKNNTGNFNYFKEKLEVLKEKIINANEEDLNSKLKEVKDIDISALDEEKKNEIEEKINNIQGLINKGKYNSASKILDGFVDNIKGEIRNVAYSEVNGGYSLEYRNKAGSLIGQSVVVIKILNENDMEIINSSGEAVGNFYIDESGVKKNYDIYSDEEVKEHCSIIVNYQFGMFKSKGDKIWEGSISPYILITNLGNTNQERAVIEKFNDKPTNKAKIEILSGAIEITYDNGKSYKLKKVSDSLNADDILKLN